jgi:hypothetical protein
LGLKDEIETNQNFIKGPMTKIENKNKKNWSGNPDKYKENSESLHGQREFKGRREKRRGETLSATNRATTDHMHNPNRKITSWCFQRQDERRILDVERHYTHCLESVDASHTLVRVLHALTTFYLFFIFYN